MQMRDSCQAWLITARLGYGGAIRSGNYCPACVTASRASRLPHSGTEIRKNRTF